VAQVYKEKQVLRGILESKASQGSKVQLESWGRPAYVVLRDSKGLQDSLEKLE
jgi:hypothetical protein